MNEPRYIQPLDQMARISREEFGKQLDEILDIVTRDNVGYVITDEGKDDLVLCPAHWFECGNMTADPAYETIEFTIDSDLYEKAGEIFKKHGLTHEEAIRLFLKETVRLGRLPFEYAQEDLREAKALSGEVTDGGK